MCTCTCFGELSVIGDIVSVCKVWVCGSCGMGDMERCIVSACVLSGFVLSSEWCECVYVGCCLVLLVVGVV